MKNWLMDDISGNTSFGKLIKLIRAEISHVGRRPKKSGFLLSLCQMFLSLLVTVGLKEKNERCDVAL
jgi:hypothetical protein